MRVYVSKSPCRDKKHYVILSRPALFDVCLSISEVPFYEYQWKAQDLIRIPIVSKVRIVMEIYGRLCGKKEKKLLYARSNISDELKSCSFQSSKMGKC